MHQNTGTTALHRAIEHRRSGRYRSTALVEIVHGGRRRLLNAVDASRHGIFVAIDKPLRERFLVQVTIHLPDGPLAATAFVSRSVSAPSSGTEHHGLEPRILEPPISGMGLQFFALSATAKGRWDRYFLALADGHAPSDGSVPVVSDAPTFLVKLKDHARIREFYSRYYAAGSLYLATPVLHEVGAKIALSVIHPITEDDYPLFGTVARVRRTPPKGMQIRLDLQGDRERLAFSTFVETGIWVSQVLRSAGGALELAARANAIDAPVEGAVTPVTPITSVTPVAPVTSVTSVTTLIASPALAATPLVSGESNARSAGYDTAGASGDISVDIIVEEEELDASEGAGTDPVGVAQGGEDYQLIIEDPVSIRPVESGTSAYLGDFPEEVLRGGGSIRVHCNRCDDPGFTVTVGRAPGPMGFLAELHPYWCANCAALVSAVRLTSAEKRKRMLDALGGRESALAGCPVTLAFAFDVASLTSTPRCESCGRPVRVTRHVAAVRTALGKLEGTETLSQETRVRCKACKAGVWVVDRCEPTT